MVIGKGLGAGITLNVQLRNINLTKMVAHKLSEIIFKK